jgi:hypothetical protein
MQLKRIVQIMDLETVAQSLNRVHSDESSLPCYHSTCSKFFYDAFLQFFSLPSTRQAHASTYLPERNHRRVSLKLFGHFLARMPARLTAMQARRASDPGAQAEDPGQGCRAVDGLPGRGCPKARKNRQAGDCSVLRC